MRNLIFLENRRVMDRAFKSMSSPLPLGNFYRHWQIDRCLLQGVFIFQELKPRVPKGKQHFHILLLEIVHLPGWPMVVDHFKLQNCKWLIVYFLFALPPPLWFPAPTNCTFLESSRSHLSFKIVKTIIPYFSHTRITEARLRSRAMRDQYDEVITEFDWRALPRSLTVVRRANGRPFVCMANWAKRRG